MKIATVIRDEDGDIWVRTGDDRWNTRGDLSSPVSVARWGVTIEKVKAEYGPIEIIAEVNV